MNLSSAQYHESASGAVISPCSTYRYVLWRRWGDSPPLGIIGLNPSTADATLDDPTIRRCINFAKREGCGGLVMMNLFGFRSTNPKVLDRHKFGAIGIDNEKAWVEWFKICGKLVAAWGAGAPDWSPQQSSVSAKAVDALGGLWCFGKTKDGSPRHPLYLRSDAPLEVWCGTPCLSWDMKPHPSPMAVVDQMAKEFRNITGKSSQ